MYKFETKVIDHRLPIVHGKQQAIVGDPLNLFCVSHNYHRQCTVFLKTQKNCVPNIGPFLPDPCVWNATPPIRFHPRAFLKNNIGYTANIF